MLSFSAIPPEFKEFVQAKQRQLAFNMLSSSAAGVLVANVAALIAGHTALAALAIVAVGLGPVILMNASQKQRTVNPNTA